MYEKKRGYTKSYRWYKARGIVAPGLLGIVMDLEINTFEASKTKTAEEYAQLMKTRKG